MLGALPGWRGQSGMGKTGREMAGVRFSAGPASGDWLGHFLGFFQWMVVCVIGHSHVGRADLETDNDDPGMRGFRN